MSTTKIPQSPRYDSNIERLGDHTDTCICCGLRTAEKLFIHATTDWEAIDEIDEKKVPNSQGLFPIGPECAKKLPKQFIF